MSSVEALEQTVTDTAPPSQTTPEVDTSPSLDTELDGIWDRAFVTNGADRGSDGKFTSPNAEIPSEEPEEPPSLEGETGEEQPGSTPGAVPLPANRLLNSLDAEWAALTPEVQQKLTERSNELHKSLSDMGKQVSQYKPLQEAATEFAEYFNGNLRGADGQPINPADGIRYLANIQRAMDRDPLNTLMSIADTYGLREHLADAFGGQVQTVPQDQRILLDEIAGLKRTIAGLNDPARVEQVLESREVQSVVSRFASDTSKPHYAQVEADLPFFIGKAKTLLGDGASYQALLDKGYELAVQADPALRAQTEAARTAAAGTNAKAEAAKRATSVNVTSTSTGKPRQPSIEDELGAIWEKSRKA